MKKETRILFITISQILLQYIIATKSFLNIQLNQ